MKRTFIVVALAIVLALSFATIATAKYAGYAYNNPVKNTDSTSSPNPNPGYLSWTGANAIYNRDNNVTTGQTSAHGGYVSTTVKCAVCHSAHRATSPAASTAGVAFASTKLVASSGCVSCHTGWGAGGSDKKIEWENLLTTTSPDPGGPHHHADPTCTNKCHTGGAHGGGTSAYNGMNAYMLGSDKDAAITAAFVAGNVSDRISYDPTNSGDGMGNQWFQSGTTGTPSDGTYPADIAVGATGARPQANFAAAKAMATGYTCAQAGCHTNSQFAVNKWGYSENLTGVTSDPVVAPATTSAMTGHLTGGFSHGGAGVTSGSANPSCAPCHPGGLAGGYRTLTSTADQEKNKLATSYGCDQCHDLVGRLTNTTAWPHGNRAIDVYEWDKNGNQTIIAAADLPSGNIWMYSSDISQSGLRTSTVVASDPSFTLVQGTIYHDLKVGSINDGVCLKCHIPVDSKSLQARGIDPATGSINPATTRSHGSYYENGTLNVRNDNSADSNRIFLWK